MLRAACTVALAAAALAQPVASAGQTAAATRDGPGTYFLFRTFVGADAPTAAQNKDCDERYGDQSFLIVSRSTALAYTPKVERATGLAVDEKAKFLGPAYICGKAGLTPDLVENYAHLLLPSSRADADGTCAPSLPSFVRAATFLSCRMDVDPMPALGSPGGFAASNTISGSIFIAFIERDPSKPVPKKPALPERPMTETPNNPDFYLWRAMSATTVPMSTACQSAGALMPGPARTSTLSATQPDLATGALNPKELLTKTADVTLCFTGGSGSTHYAAAIAKIKRAGKTVTVTTFGECRDSAMPSGRKDLLMQSCALSVLWADSPLFRAGQLTSNGLVRADNPTVAANSHVWSLGMLDGETQG